ncbi:MAG TPA: SLATT domain-containing protein [Coleofasciculaceae cyanobacterium]|jgi:hypothetical protein
MTLNVENELESQANVTEIKAKVEYLRVKIEDAIRRVRISRKNNQTKASYIKVFIILLSGTATVLLGLQISGLQTQFKDIAFVLTALVTVLNALEPFFNFRALWIEHETALWKLYRLRNKIEYYTAGNEAENMSIEKIDGFQAEYQAVWDDLSQSWIAYRKQEKS